MTIKKQDFNKLPDDWTDKFDFIFSNSIDHAYDPEQTLKEWRRCCTGRILCEFSYAGETNIEHTFTKSYINKISTGMRIIKQSVNEERRVLVTLFEVVK